MLEREKIDRRTIIQNLLHAVQINDTEAGKAYLDPNVILYLDENRSSGKESWARWVQYLHMHPIHFVSFEIDQFVNAGADSIHIIGTLILETGEGNNKVTNIELEFTFQENKITKIQSRRKNYTGILGESFVWKPMAIWHCLLMRFYILRGDLK